jgi:hypothetical protein
MSLIPAMPSTMVKKIIGAISMVIKLINTLLISCAVGAKPLKYKPTTTPNIMAIITWKVRLLIRRFIKTIIRLFGEEEMKWKVERYKVES